MQLAQASEAHVQAWQIPWTMATYLQYEGHWPDYIATQRSGLAASAALGDLQGQTRTLHNLGLALLITGDLSGARSEMARSLILGQRTGDPLRSARAHVGLGWLAEREGRYDEAVEQSQQALSLYQSSGDVRGQREALASIGWYLTKRGEYEQAIDLCEQALQLDHESNAVGYEAQILDTIGYACVKLGRLDEFMARYTTALSLFRQLSSRGPTAVVLRHLAEVYESTGDFPAAEAALQEAVQILTELNHPEETEARRQLRSLHKAQPRQLH